MTDTARDRAAGTYRKQLRQRGLSVFEVLGLATDRELIRSLAKRLAEGGPEANRLRATIRRALTEESQRRSGIYAALRRSPLVGTGIRFRRERTPSR